MTGIRSLRTRLTLQFTFITTALLLAVALGMLGYTAQRSSRQADRALAASRRRVLSEAAEEGMIKAPEELVREENELLENAGGAMVVLDLQGRVRAQSRRIIPTWPRPSFDDGWRAITIPVPDGVVVVGIPWWKTRAELAREASLLLGMVVCVAFCTAIGSWWLIGRTLRPIGELARQAEAASASRPDLSLNLPSEDRELVELVGTLNRLLARLSQAAAADVRFHVAASHELRTPLQALSGHLELALTRERSSAEYRKVVEEAFGQTRRLTQLVRELLLLNQLHRRTIRPQTESVELSGLVQRQIDQLQPLVTARGIHVLEELPNDVEIEAPPAHAELLCRNLLENGVKYSPTAGTITVRLERVAAAWRFEVRNECSVPIDAEPEQLFEPFFRPDVSRASGTGGNGLGLAICKAVSEANDWTLEWNREGTFVRRGSIPGSVRKPPCRRWNRGESCHCAGVMTE